jgi:hypothetical protein
MCDDLKSEVAALAAKGVQCSELHEERWGSITWIPLPAEAESVSTGRSIRWQSQIRVI